MIYEDILIPQVLIPSVLTMMAAMSIYSNIYRGKLKNKVTRIKDFLIQQSLAGDPF